MSRIGICLQCGQRYGDIPDSVTATRVKCKVCAGVVEIPPLAAGASAAPSAPAAPPAPPPAPAAAAPAKPVIEAKAAPIPIAPRPAPPAVPASPAIPPAKPAAVIPTKPLFAPKPAAKPIAPVAPAAPAAAARPVAPIAKPAPAPVKPATPAPKPPPPAAPAARPAPAPLRPAAPPAPVVKAAPPAPAATAKPSAAEILAAAKAKRAAAAAPAAAPAAARHAAPAPAPRPAVAASAARRPGRAEREEREERHGYQKPASKTPLILSVVLIVVCAGAGALWYAVNKNAPKPEPAAPVVMATPPAAQPIPTADPGATGPAQPAAPASASQPKPAANEPEAAPAAAPEPDRPAEPASAGFDASYVFVVPEPGKPLVVPRGKVDPAVLTLEKAPPLQRWSKTSDATWQSVEGDLALYLENSGARSNRAGDALVKAGRDAYPAMVMAMMRQDYTTVDGVKMAGSLNDLIGKIVGGENFGWRSAERYPVGSDEWTDAVLWQKKAAMLRYNRWVDKLREGDGEWEIIAKKGGASGIRKDEEGAEVGDVPPDLPPDEGPPDGR